VFFPYLLTPSQDKTNFSQEPFFSGYLFVKLDLAKEGISAFQWMPDTDGLVWMGEEPAFVPDSLIRAIDVRLDQMNGLVRQSMVKSSPPQEDPVHESSLEILGKLFDPSLSSEDRVQALMREMKLTPEPKAA